MYASSLLASAGINMGLGLIILSLFSVLKKQKWTAYVYVPRRISQRQLLHYERHFTLHRFLPSVQWILRAARVTEDEILDCCGLDTLILIRLFKFGFIEALKHLTEATTSPFANSAFRPPLTSLLCTTGLAFTSTAFVELAVVVKVPDGTGINRRTTPPEITLDESLSLFVKFLHRLNHLLRQRYRNLVIYHFKKPPILTRVPNFVDDFIPSIIGSWHRLIQVNDGVKSAVKEFAEEERYNFCT